MPYQFYKLKENQKEAGEHPNWTTSDEEIPATAHHVSVFSLSAKPIKGDDAHNSKIRFSGDFIAEIDGENLDHAIREAILIKKFLVSINVDLASCKISISGNKGFHVVIPFECFGGYAAPDLPKIFKKVAISIAQETGITSLDHAMFNGGGTPFKLPQSLRQPNMQRANGHYKVQIQWGELDEITPENYFEHCAVPHDLIDLTPPKENRKLMDLYSAAVCELRDEATQNKDFATLENADFEVLNGTVPACFKQLEAYENISSENGGWNNAKRTAARGYASGVIGDAELALIAQNFQSTRNPTPAGRFAELKTLAASFTKSGKGFGCGYALQILDKNPCKGCPIKPICAKKQTTQNLINKITTNQKHIAAVIKELKTSTGDTKTKLGHTLCKCLAKGTPSKRSIDDSIEIAVTNGVDEGVAREIIERDVSLRANRMRSANKITNFEGLTRVNVDGLSHDEIANLVLSKIDLDSYFKSRLGNPATMKPTTVIMNLKMAAGKTVTTAKVYERIQNKLLKLLEEYKIKSLGEEPSFYFYDAEELGKFNNYMRLAQGSQIYNLKPIDFIMNATAVAHRVSLIKGLSERFEVAYYQLIDIKRDFKGSFATCVDSLPQFKTRNPILIIDEARQTLEHLATAETIGSSDKNEGGRAGLYNHFKACYESASLTILLDADMDDLTVEWFRQNGQGKEFVLFEMSDQEHTANHTILTGGHDEARRKIFELLEQGRRGVVACTSEIECLMTYKWLKKKGFTHGKASRILVLTGSNKGDVRQAAFLANPTKESEKYDLIIHSPVIGSGVSLENPNLTFSVLMNTCVVPSNEALQMLGRNRCATDIFVSFGKPSNYDRVTDPQIFIDAEKDRIVENHYAEMSNRGFESGLTLAEYAATLKESALTKLQSQIVAKRNLDLNDYENNFVLLAQLNGRSFEYSRVTKSDVTIKGLRAETITEIIDNQFNAIPIDTTTVESYKQRETALTQQESNELERFSVCEMAGTNDIEPVDVENHLNGAFGVVTAVETLLKPISDLQAIDAKNRKTLNKQASKVKEQRIFNEIFAVLSEQTFEEFFKSGATNILKVDQGKAISICKLLKKHHRELSGRYDYSKIPKDTVRRANSYLGKYGFYAIKSSENKERNYTLFFDDKIALYVNNRAGFRSSS